MLYRAIEPEEFFNEKDADHEIVDILQNNGAHLKLVYLKKENSFDSHVSNTDVCIYLLNGELEISFSKENNCGCGICGCDEAEEDENYRKYKIKKGQLFLFEKDVLHSLTALKDSAFMLIKI